MTHRVDLTDRSSAEDFPGREGSGGHRYRREDRDELATTKPGAGWGNFRGRLHRVLDIRKEPKAIDVGISGARAPATVDCVAPRGVEGGHGRLVPPGW